MNLALGTDSYKLNHWNQYPPGTTGIYSYLEAREGAEYPYTVFFGLQSLLHELVQAQTDLTRAKVARAWEIAQAHFGRDDLFNARGWYTIVTELNGRLPLRIKAVPEGTPVPVGNVLMTVENTDPRFPGLTNFVESLLMHVWYPSTVATRSREVKRLLAQFLDATCDDGASGLLFPGGPRRLDLMLHDFGFRGAASYEAASRGAAAHLVNFVGTDTPPGMELAMRDYAANLETLGFSVPATEHSVMTAEGRDGELDVVKRLLAEYPTGVLSVVADSYDIYAFVDMIGTEFKDRILERDGVFVVRPDSTTSRHATPDSLVVWIAQRLWDLFGGEVNAKGFRVINPKVRILWGDGITPQGIRLILGSLQIRGFAAENMAAFGMGGGLLQKLNRDTQRMAIKASAIQIDGGEWKSIRKTTKSKQSKAGRLVLCRHSDGGYTTAAIPAGHQPEDYGDVLQTVFENGRMLNTTTFDEVRARAAL